MAAAGASARVLQCAGQKVESVRQTARIGDTSERVTLDSSATRMANAEDTQSASKMHYVFLYVLNIK